MNLCFAGCTSLIYLDIRDWIINRDCHIKDIFKGCKNLSIIRCRQDTFNVLMIELGDGWVYEYGYAIKY